MKKYLKFILFIFVIATLIVLGSGLYISYKNDYNFNYKRGETIVDYSLIKDSYIKKSHLNYVKNVPEKYLLQFTIVCSHFTELKEENISLAFEKIETTMQARPYSDFLIGDRRYFVTINSDDSFEGIDFDDIPFNAQIGIIAHEFCHIIDYKEKSALEIIGTGVAYMNDKEKREYEREIDLLTLKKGFGYQLRDWAQYAMFESNATDEYKQFKKDFYLNPHEIDSLLIN